MTVYALASLGFWRAYLITLRPYLCFVSAISGLVGIALAPAGHVARSSAAGIAFFFAYGFGQALTDVFQTDTDALSAPYRPLPRGLISRQQVFGVSVLGLMGCAAVFVVLNPSALIPCVMGVMGLIAYTPFKRRWWAGPACNSWIVALLPAIGWLSAHPRHFMPKTPALYWVMASVFFSYAIFVVLGYLKDVEADRQTGYITFPVRFGRKATVLFSCTLLLVSMFCSFKLLRLTTTPASVLSFWITGCGLLVGAHLYSWKAETDAEAHVGIGLSVRGYTVLHAAEAAAFQPNWLWPSLVLFLVFEASLRRRPERTQI